VNILQRSITVIYIAINFGLQQFNLLLQIYFKTTKNTSIRVDINLCFIKSYFFEKKFLVRTGCIDFGLNLLFSTWSISLP